MKNQSLEFLEKWCLCENIAIIGAGPSLDYCIKEIESLIENDTVFFLTDIVAKRFIKEFPSSKRLIFTVEGRYHGYLKGLENENIACYINSNPYNYRSTRNHFYFFHFDFDNPGQNNQSLMLKSIGTVIGPAVYFSLYLHKKNKITQNLFLFGIDLAYLENQVYSRFSFSLKEDHTCYFKNREVQEWVILLKRASLGFILGGRLIRTSHEFQKSRENFNTLLEYYKEPLNIYDFSPFGVSDKFVKKITPEKIMTELSAT